MKCSGVFIIVLFVVVCVCGVLMFLRVLIWVGRVCV